MRKAGCVVHDERWVHELALVTPAGRLREARLDLVVHVGGRCFYLDVRCFHPLSGTGRVPSGGQGTCASTERRKHTRYDATHTSAELVPVAASSLGSVGQQARDFFSLVERSAARSGRRVADPLAAVVSLLAVTYSAANVIQAYLPPDGVLAERLEAESND